MAVETMTTRLENAGFSVQLCLTWILWNTRSAASVVC